GAVGQSITIAIAGPSAAAMTLLSREARTAVRACRHMATCQGSKILLISARRKVGATAARGGGSIPLRRYRNRSPLRRWGVCWNRLADFPLVTKGIEEKEKRGRHSIRREVRPKLRASFDRRTRTHSPGCRLA